MYKILLCLRYLRTRYIALASIVSVMLGVATMIVVNSVMAGFSTEMRDRIHGILADVVVETRSLDGIPDANAQLARIERVAGKYIDAMTPTVEVYAIMTISFAGGHYPVPITLIGIEPEGKASVGPLKQYLDSYNPIIEDKQVVRPALRSADEPAGWELTPEAMAYRRDMKERQRYFFQHGRSGPDAFPPDAFPPDASSAEVDPAEDSPIIQTAGTDEANDQPPPFEDQPIETANAAVVTADATSDESASTAGASSEQSEQSDGAAGESSGDVEQAAPGMPETPFGPDPFNNEQISEAAENDAELLDARLYVGDSLIGFPVEDPETGDTRTHYMVQPGDDVIVSTVSASNPAPEVVKFNATIVDRFKSGMSEYDSNLVFMNLAELQRMRGMHLSNSITQVQIKLKDYAYAPRVVKLLQHEFPPGDVQVRTWEQKQGPLLEAVEVESAILNVLLFLIIAVAGFGILAIFYMIVVEKTRDIGILKALGASSGGVMSVFLSYGLALGVVGSGIGVVLGLLFVKYINQIEDGLSYLTGQKVFDEKIYYFFEIPTRVNPMMVVWVALGAMTIAVLASVLPARRAAALRPVEALRFE